MEPHFRDWPAGVWALLVVEAISLVALVHLWRRPRDPSAKVLWTFLVLIPLVGPLLYASIFEDPPDPVRGRKINRGGGFPGVDGTSGDALD